MLTVCMYNINYVYYDQNNSFVSWIAASTGMSRLVHFLPHGWQTRKNASKFFLYEFLYTMDAIFCCAILVVSVVMYIIMKRFANDVFCTKPHRQLAPLIGYLDNGHIFTFIYYHVVSLCHSCNTHQTWLVIKEKTNNENSFVCNCWNLSVHCSM